MFNVYTFWLVQIFHYYYCFYIRTEQKKNAGFRILVFFFQKTKEIMSKQKNCVFVFMWRNFARSHINFDVDDDYKWNG